MIILKRTQEDSWGRKVVRVDYKVLVTREGKSSILYDFSQLEKTDDALRIRKKEYIKPYSLSFVNAKNVNEINKLDYIAGYRYGGSKNPYEEVHADLDEVCLEIPPQYKREEIKIKRTKDEEITDDMLDRIRKLHIKLGFSYPIVLIGEDFEKGEADARIDGAFEYHCTKCHKSFYPRVEKSNRWGYLNCPYCENQMSNRNVLVMSNFKDFHKKNYDTHTYGNYGGGRIDSPTVKKDRFYFMTAQDNGIILYKICRETIAEKNTITEHFGIEYSLEHFVGKKMVSYKHLKKGKKECDPFEVLNINTKNINDVPNIIYDGAEDFFEFASNNEKFLRMSGFQTVLKYSSMNLDLRPFFLVFLGIMNKYPVMEQIVKMGHARLFFNLYQSMLQSLNKDEINRNVEKISQLVDNEATKGKDALRFPMYIGDYLIKKNASIEEYYYWRDLYELTHITKEQFENFTESFNFAWVNSQVGLEDICNILKFDYPIDKLFNYIVKQSRVCKRSVHDIIQNFSDYLNMCDISEVEADKYPQNVINQHNDMLAYFKKREKTAYDARLTTIGVECERYVIPDEEELKNVGVPKLFETMTVVFPKNEADFINEGNQQHNCVGSYPGRVRNGHCVVFFIRNKDNPDKSFITAECTRSGLGQCFYSNNRAVHDEQLMKFARYIANKIKTGCSSGKIHALQNIQK